MHSHHPPTAHGAGERAAIICGIGAALPPTVVSNTELCARLETTEEWIRTRTGITQRCIADTEVSTEDLAAQAAAEALRACGADSVQALVLATTTPDLRCPATAPKVATRLSLTGIPALDLAAGCTGFLYALATAVGFIASTVADAVLVIGADRLSTLPAPDDRHHPHLARHEHRRPAHRHTREREGAAVNGALESILLTDLKVPADRLSPDVGLDDAGLDSLAIVELSVLLGERLGIEISDAEISSAADLSELDRLIEQKRKDG